MKRVFYVGSFKFPDGDAAGARVLGVGKALRAAGFEVVYGGWEAGSRPQDAMVGVPGAYCYQGFRYVSQDEFRHKRLAPAARLQKYLAQGSKTVRWLEGEIEEGDVVIAYHGHSLFVSRLDRLCRNRGATLVVDCTEWYRPEHLVGGRFGVVRWDEELRMRVLNGRVGNLIVISRYLEKYYQAQGCNVLRVPPLVDLEDAKWHSPTEREAKSEVVLAYAGTPGRKDLLGNAIRGLDLLVRRGLPVRLLILGPGRDEVASCLRGDAGRLKSIGDAIEICGRVPQLEVPRYLAQCDFSVLLRPTLAYAEAGFPTKVVESMAAGLPVMTNPTSDIGKCVEHRRHGILLDGSSASALVRGVEEALSMSSSERRTMRDAARSRAAEMFDFRAHTERLGRFVHGL